MLHNTPDCGLSLGYGHHTFFWQACSATDERTAVQRSDSRIRKNIKEYLWLKSNIDELVVILIDFVQILML